MSAIPHRCDIRHVLAGSAVLTAALLWGGAPRLLAQDAVLSYDFEDENIDDFFSPEQVLLCGDVAPSGAGLPDDGNILLTNDPLFGISIFALKPDVVNASFPASRDYKVRLRFNLDTVNELVVFLRARIGVDLASGVADAEFERAYSFAVVAPGLDPILVDGVLALGEMTACHDTVEHPEWPGAAEVGEDFARVDPGTPIIPGDWYWAEFAAQGDDNGGPVILTGKIWPDGDDPPEFPSLLAVDPDGLPHTADTLSDDKNVQVLIGASFDFGQQPNATARIDDLSIHMLQGCPDAPARATRRLWDNRIFAEGRDTALFELDQQYQVTIELSDLREGGDCGAPAGLRVTEIVPEGWEVSDVSPAAQLDENRLVWDIDLGGGGGGLPVLSYTVTPTTPGVAQFTGTVTETDSEFLFFTEGESVAASTEAVAPISDFGTIQHWLILGPFMQPGGANPGEDAILLDYLTDGDTTEINMLPRAGDTIVPDYNGAAASTGLAPNTKGRNPDDIPTWIEWRDFDDNDDRIDFESVYGDLSDIVCYAVTYLNVLDDTIVNFGVSSDDAIHILLDGETLHANPVARGALDRVYQDTPFTHPNLGNVELTSGIHILVVKVFEGGGEHNFRVGFVDEFGFEIPGGPSEIEICLEPDCGVPPPPKEQFRRGDVDGNGELEITDPIALLQHLFLGQPGPTCPDAADANDEGQLTISSAIFILSFLFTGGAEPPPPGPAECGPDPTPDDLGPCEYDC